MSKEEAIEVLKDIYNYKRFDTYTTNEARTMAIKALEQEPKWIPVGERLPEKNVWVLVTVEQNDYRYQEIMRRCEYKEAWTDNIDIYTDEITAWMPLPESYKSESEAAE